MTSPPEQPQAYPHKHRHQQQHRQAARTCAAWTRQTRQPRQATNRPTLQEDESLEPDHSLFVFPSLFLSICISFTPPRRPHTSNLTQPHHNRMRVAKTRLGHLASSCVDYRPIGPLDDPKGDTALDWLQRNAAYLHIRTGDAARATQASLAHELRGISVGHDTRFSRRGHSHLQFDHD